MFYEMLKLKAMQVTKSTEDAIAGRQSVSRYDMQVLFFDFCQTVDVLNRLVMYSVLKGMWPLLLNIVQYQEKHGLEGHLGTLQAVRFHAEPRALHSELVQRVALLNAGWRKMNRPPEQNLKSCKLVRCEKPTLAVALYDLHDLSPILQLLLKALLQLLRRAETRRDLRVHILATQKPNLEVAQVSDLHSAFSAAGCWHDVFDAKTGVLPSKLTEQQLTRYRRKVKQIGITVVLDGIGSSALGSEGFYGLCIPGSEVLFIYDFLNSAVLPRDSHSYSGVILDPVLSAAVPDDDLQATSDRFCCISCWQPPVMDCIEGLNRSERTVFRAGAGQKFRFHTPVDLTQISRECLEQLLELLVALPDGVLCYYGAPLTQIFATMINMQSYAEQHGLDKNYFDGRVDWWGHLPMEDHGQRMRDKVHVCLALGPGTGHIGVNLALCVGVPVVTEQGLHGGGDISSWVPSSMLKMLGLGALAVPYGSRAGDLVKQLYHDGPLLMSLQSILDHQATHFIGFFDRDRTANDLAELVIAHHVSDPPARDFISRLPEPPYFELDQHGKLQQTARALVREGNDQLRDRDTEVLPVILDFHAPDIEEMDADFEPSSAGDVSAGANAQMPAKSPLLDGEPLLDGDDAELICALSTTFLDLTNVDEGGGCRAVFGEPPSAGDLLG